MGTIRTNRTNQHLGQGSHGVQRLRNILSPPNDMHFAIRQRVVSHGHDSYESNESTPRTRVSWHTACLRNILSSPNDMHFSIRQRVVSHGHDSNESNESTPRTRVSWHTACLRNILSPPNDMHFSIRQRVVSKNVLLVRIDDSIASAQLFYDSYLFRCIGQPWLHIAFVKRDT